MNLDDLETADLEELYAALLTHKVSAWRQRVLRHLETDIENRKARELSEMPEVAEETKAERKLDELRDMGIL